MNKKARRQEREAFPKPQFWTAATPYEMTGTPYEISCGQRQQDVVTKITFVILARTFVTPL